MAFRYSNYYYSIYAAKLSPSPSQIHKFIGNAQAQKVFKISNHQPTAICLGNHYSKVTPTFQKAYLFFHSFYLQESESVLIEQGLIPCLKDLSQKEGYSLV